MTPRRRNEQALVRPHVVTGGRAHPSRNIFDLVTLVVAAGDLPVGGLPPEQRRIVNLCGGGALSVAEIAAHLALPIGIVKVLLSDLMDSGHINTRSQGPAVESTQRIRLLQEVLDGLRATL